MFLLSFTIKTYSLGKSEWSNKTFQSGKYKGYVSKDGKSCCLTEMTIDKAVKKVVIPSAIDGMKVTRLDHVIRNVTFQNLFADDSDDLASYSGKYQVETIIVPNTVTEISDQVFCLLPKLKTVSLSKDLKKMGREVFVGAKSLKTLSLPASLTSINLHTFDDAYALEKVIISKKNKLFTSIKSGIFTKNGKTLLMTIGKSGKIDIGKKVTIIKPYLVTDGWKDLRGMKGYTRDYYSNKTNVMTINQEKFDFYVYPYLSNHDITISPKNKVFTKKDHCIYLKKTGELLYYTKSTKKIRIAKGVKKITKRVMWGDEAEYNNYIYLPSTLTYFDLHSLPMNEDYLSDIYFSSKKPPKIVGKSLLKKSLKDVKIHVPKSAVSAYKKVLENTPVKIVGK